MDNLLQNIIKEMQAVHTSEEFDIMMSRIVEYLSKERYAEQTIQTVRNKGKYLKNVFSDQTTKENMLNAKENVVFELKHILRENPALSYQTQYLERYLENFYLFLEALREKQPDGRASDSIKELQNIKIENEYDLQHLLYAALKPFYIDLRKEVSEDSGIGTVRSDMKIPAMNAVIETKCTRKSMTEKKLIEEMEADIVHYDAENIFFYVYDKMKLIKDKTTFENYFNKDFMMKHIRVFLIQPIRL